MRLSYYSKHIETDHGQAMITVEYTGYKSENVEGFKLYHYGADFTDFVTDTILDEAFGKIAQEEACHESMVL
jgi:hypothetical protein